MFDRATLVLAVFNLEILMLSAFTVCSFFTCRIPYRIMCQVSFVGKKFIVNYVDQAVVKRLEWELPCRVVAKSLFCKVAEEQVFFFHDTVTDSVRNQADLERSSSGWKKFYHKVQIIIYIYSGASYNGPSHQRTTSK